MIYRLVCAVFGHAWEASDWLTARVCRRCDTLEWR